MTTEALTFAILLTPDLSMHDGEGGGEAAASSAAEGATQAEGAPEAAPEASQTESTTQTATPEQRQKAFRDLINGEYKAEYTEATQRMIDRRMRPMKEMQERLKSAEQLMSVLSSRYGVDADPAALAKAVEDDTAFWADAAEEAGLTVEQYKQMQKLQRENAQLRAMQQQRQTDEAVNKQVQQWYAEGEALKSKYPQFDLAREVADEQFVGMLKAGVPVELAFKVRHMDEMVESAISTTAQRTEKAVTENIKARGARPKENGSAQQAAFTVKQDVSKLSEAEVLDIMRRVANGEKISFG